MSAITSAYLLHSSVDWARLFCLQMQYAHIPKLSFQQLQLFVLGLRYRVRMPGVCMVAGAADLILELTFPEFSVPQSYSALTTMVIQSFY